MFWSLKTVKGDHELLKTIVLRHAVKGTWVAGEVVTLDGKEVETLSGPSTRRC